MKKLALLFSSLLLFCGVVLADTVTPRTGMTKPSINSPNWGPKLNSNFDIMDSSFAAVNSTNTFTKTQTIPDLRVTSITVPTGSASNPSIKVGAPTTGVYSPSSGILSFSINGVSVGRFQSTGFESDFGYGGTTAAFSGQLSGKGTVTNDSASTGYIGEYISSSTIQINGPVKDVWADVISIPITAGDWDVNIACEFNLNGATGLNDLFIGASVYAGNSPTGMVQGISSLELGFPVGVQPTGSTLSQIRFSVSSLSTVYLKVFEGGYAGGPIKVTAGMSARRVR
jgi:hypothetical protein